MTGAHLLNSYLTLNLLIIIGYLILRIIRFRPSFQLQIQYTSIGFFLLLSLAQPFFPDSRFMNSTIKIWAAESMESGVKMEDEGMEKQIVSFSRGKTSTIPKHTPIAFVIPILALIIFTIWKMMREVLMLKKIVSSAYVFRKINGVHILIHDKISMPFSFWLPGNYFTVIPESFLLKSKHLKVSIHHELQHHRQGDTQASYVLILLRAVCFLNPFSHLLCRDVKEVQELACDEAVISSQKVSLPDYIGCLVQVAQTVVSSKFDPECAAGFCFNGRRHILKRRIQMMNVKHRPIAQWMKSCALILAVMIVSLTVYASKNLVQDRRISLAEAEEMANKASRDSDFPIVMNEEVLAQMNRFLGTPEGRDYMRSAFEKKKDFEPVLSHAVAKYHTPEELNAIPVVESGYKNLPSRYSVKAAGIWMFIPATARKFGMKVQKGLDERLNVTKQTDGAHRYLLANKLIFDDWLLAIFAYNVGEGAVERGIKKYRTRDVWTLSKHIKGDQDYLAKVMASVIIMKNLEVLD